MHAAAEDLALRPLALYFESDGCPLRFAGLFEQLVYAESCNADLTARLSDAHGGVSCASPIAKNHRVRPGREWFFARPKSKRPTPLAWHDGLDPETDHPTAEVCIERLSETNC